MIVTHGNIVQSMQTKFDGKFINVPQVEKNECFKILFFRYQLQNLWKLMMAISIWSLGVKLRIWQMRMEGLEGRNFSSIKMQFESIFTYFI